MRRWLGPDCALSMTRLRFEMVENNNSSSARSQSPESTESVGERLERLRQKVSGLSETLKRVEETAAEAGGQLKE